MTASSKRQRARRRPRGEVAKPARRRIPAWVPVVAGVAAVLLLLGALARSDSPGPRATAGEGGDTVAHVHGLGVNPADGTLYAATHFGLYRLADGEVPERVGDTYQDTMGFSVVGADHFLASGHPDAASRMRQPGKPPLLGLIESTDAGRTWRSLSLLGKADFHALVAAHGGVYGFNAINGRFMVSADGKQWDIRSRVPMSSFAVDPADADHVLAVTDQGLAESRDGGRTFEVVSGPPLVFLSWNATQGLWGVAPSGEIYERAASGWEPRKPVKGRPQAILVTDDEVYAAAEVDGATRILVSRDGGESWTLRYREPGA